VVVSRVCGSATVPGVTVHSLGSAIRAGSITIVEIDRMRILREYEYKKEAKEKKWKYMNVEREERG
jgi:hypothetical protein